MSNLYNNNSDEENFLAGYAKKNSFVVPESYFDTLAARIILKIEREEELKGLNTLAEIPKRSTFEVPENYFKSGENKLELLWEASNYTTISGLKKTLSSDEQTDYFKALDAKILNKIEANDELKEFNVLSSIPKKNNFKTPASYFEKKEAKVIPIGNTTNAGGVVRRLFSSRIAIAASIILIIGTGITWYIQHQELPADPGDCHTLACLEKNEILNEHTISDFDEDNLYDMVNVDSLGKQVAGNAAVDSASVQKNTADSIKEIEDSKK